MLPSLTRRAATNGDMRGPLTLSLGLIAMFIIVCAMASLFACVRRSERKSPETISSTQVPIHASWYARAIKKKMPTDTETGSLELQQIPNAAIMQRRRVLRKLQKAKPNIPLRPEDAKPTFDSLFGRGGSIGRAASFKDIGKEVPMPATKPPGKTKRSPMPASQDAVPTPESGYSGLSGRTLVHTNSIHSNAATKPTVSTATAISTEPTPPHGEQARIPQQLPPLQESDSTARFTRAVNIRPTLASPRRPSFDVDTPTVSVAFGSAPHDRFKRPPRAQKVILTGEYGMSRCRTTTFEVKKLRRCSASEK